VAKTIESYIFLAGIKIFMKLNMKKSLVTIYFESVDQDITNRTFLLTRMDSEFKTGWQEITSNEKFEDIPKGVIRKRKLKYRQHNGQKKKE
jgi:hypothetical protein